MNTIYALSERHENFFAPGEESMSIETPKPGENANVSMDDDRTVRRSIALVRKEEARKRRNLIVNTCHLLLTPLTIIKGNLELVNQCNKTLTPELLSTLLKRVEEIHRRIYGELNEKINLMTVETTDGYKPAVRI